MRHAPAALAAEAASAKASTRAIVVLGDSLAAGFGVEPEQAFPALIQRKLDEARLSFQVVNAGVSGDTTAGGLRRVDWSLRRPAHVLILELGGNDGLRGIDPATTEANLKAIILKAREKQPGIRIVLAGMQMPPNMGADYTSKFERIYPTVARELGTALIPFLLEGVGGKEELNQPDGIHPTAAGHRILAENVWKVLRPILNDPPSVAPEKTN